MSTSSPRVSNVSAPSISIGDSLPELPYEDWRDTKNTLHLYLQIIGKVRLAAMPRRNHWWHVPLYVSSRGFTTRAMPHGSRLFDVAFDVLEPQVVVSATDGARRTFGVSDGMTVAAFYDNLMGALDDLNLGVDVVPEPYDHPTSTTPFPEDVSHAAYDARSVEQFWRALTHIQPIFQQFEGRFYGKSTPVHLFWHSFDLAYTRFSGREAPPMEDAGEVARDAYSHEVISFGFWAGDDTIREPAFYSYTYPEPEGLRETTLEPETAYWTEQNGGSLAVYPYDDIRTSDDPAAALLSFLESAYQSGAECAGWDVDRLRTPYGA